MIYMFRTILVHHQEQLYSYTSHLVYADTSGCRVAISTQQSDVSAYTGIYQMRCIAYKVAPDYRLIQSEICRASNGNEA